MTTVNDVVLIYLEDDPISFARIESIHPDPKKGWFQIRLLMFQIPLQTVTWILKDAYINGEAFQMNGKQMRLETIHAPKDPPAFPRDLDTDSQKTTATQKEAPPSKKGKGQIISFSDLKKTNHGPAAD